MQNCVRGTTLTRGKRRNLPLRTVRMAVAHGRLSLSGNAARQALFDVTSRTVPALRAGLFLFFVNFTYKIEKKCNKTKRYVV